MDNKLKVVKWSAIAVGAAIASTAAYVALNSIDAEAPDVSKFDNRQEMPADDDNVYCGLMAVTNLTSEATGLPAMDSVFGCQSQVPSGCAAVGSSGKTADEDGRDAIRKERREFWDRLASPSRREGVTVEEKDAVLADAAKILALIHEAAQRKAWYAFDPVAAKRVGFPPISSAMKLSRLVRPMPSAIWSGGRRARLSSPCATSSWS